MTSKRSVAVLITIAVVVSVILGSIVYKFQIQQRQQEQNPSSSQDQNQPPRLIFKAVLRVSGFLKSSYWTRNSTTDLPDYAGVVDYSVSNIGNASASSVYITVRIGGQIYSQKSISVLEPYGEFTDSFTVSTIYDSSKSVSIDASCLDSQDSTSVFLDAKLPRSTDWTSGSSITKLYITPNENNVASTENNIIDNKFPLIPNWIALRDWVGNNIKYKYDSEAHGQEDYWQLPKETLQLKTGDCEDFSILLCSLLRANGWSTNDVHVVIGEQNDNYHAWVKINLGVLGWYNIEPQADGWNTIVGDFLSLSGYDAICYFNDSQFHWTG